MLHTTRSSSSIHHIFLNFLTDSCIIIWYLDFNTDGVKAYGLLGAVAIPVLYRNEGISESSDINDEVTSPILFSRFTFLDNKRFAGCSSRINSAKHLIFSSRQLNF